MLTLNFQARFVPAVENGLAQIAGEPLPHPGVDPKRQTIRRYRKDGKDPKPGDWRALWTGLRTKASRKLGEVECSAVVPFGLTIRGPRMNINVTQGDPGVYRGPNRFQIASLVGPSLRRFNAIARADGFATAADMVAFFERFHGLPFEGLLIRW